MRERDVEAYLVAKVKSLGGIAPKWVSPGRIGVPDRICFLPGGRIVFVELKAPGQKPRPEQLREHDRLRNLGCTVAVLDSKQAIEDYFK